MAFTKKLSMTSWKQSLEGRKQLGSLSPNREVAEFCRLEDGTKRKFQFTFEGHPEYEIKDEFQITSGREISLRKIHQDKLKSIFKNDKNKIIVVNVVDVNYSNDTNTEIINTWDHIVDNCFQFNYAVKNYNSLPYKRFSQFYHWYFFPQYKLFAPSKFIGYKNTTADNYKGSGTGSETTKTLNKYFYKLDRESEEYIELKKIFESYSATLDKKLNIKTFQGSGGIYLPKKKYLSKEKTYTNSLFNIVSSDLESQIDEESINSLEGRKKERLVRFYERNPKIRTRAISYHGFTCKVCNFNFKNVYGEMGENFIEVHHLIPISNFEEERQVNYKTDMTVLCSNCHRMIHRKRNNHLSIDELKKVLREC